jgi:hypothetical protein
MREKVSKCPHIGKKSDPFLQTSIVSSKSWEKPLAIEAFWSLSRTLSGGCASAISRNRYLISREISFGIAFLR